MSKKEVREEIKLTVDTRAQVQELIEALINNYDIYVRKVEDRDYNYSGFYVNKFEVLVYERKKDE